MTTATVMRERPLSLARLLDPAVRDDPYPFYRVLRESLPDIQIEIVHTLAQGDLTVAHCRCTATHLGEGLGIAPTGRRVEFSGFALGRFADGQLVEGWNCFDFMGMYKQLGVDLDLPAPTA